jgi:hypothetical protein
MERKLNIKVSIEGIELPLTVNSTEEEEIYRRSATLIQQRLRTLRDRYPNLPSDKYYYAMVLLNTAVDAVRTADSVSAQPYQDMMADLEAELNETLK